MSKMTVALSGKVFELTMGTGGEILPTYDNCEVDEIFHAYNNVSKLKWEAWYEWYNWALFCDNVKALRITTHNSYRFVIECTYIRPTGEAFLIKITKDHNYARQVRFA